MASASNFNFLHSVLLILFSAILFAHLLRLSVLRAKVLKVCGHFNALDEFAHAAHGGLMIPMVTAFMLSSSAIRVWCVWLTLAGTIYFLILFAVSAQAFIVKRTQKFKYWDIVYAGMFLGMSVMYYSFDRSIINAQFTAGIFILSEVFYFFVSVYYLIKLFALVKERHSARFPFLLQSELSHLIIGIAMLAMFIWPQIFMATVLGARP